MTFHKTIELKLSHNIFIIRYINDFILNYKAIYICIKLHNYM